MPLNGTEKYRNRVLVSCVITGAGSYGTFTAVPTYDSAGVAGFADGDRVVYAAWAVDAYGSPTGTAWEVGIGTVGSSGTVLARTEVLAGSNGTSAVSWPASSTVRVANVRPGERDRFPILTLYTADGTHTFNASTRLWWAMAIGGGGGGGTGRKGANVSTRGGGGGGGGGGVSVAGPIPYTHGVFAPTIDIVIGFGGVSGGSATANDQNGSPGTSGQTTFVGGILTAGGGTPGGGGTAAGGGSAGTGGTGNLCNGSSGGAGGGFTTGGTGRSGPGPGGGGGGGGINAANTQGSGGAGGTRSTLYDGAGAGSSGAGGGTGGGAGGSVTGYFAGGAGGGGGGGRQPAGAPAGNGGDGGFPGGGGGGAGAATNSNSSSNAGGAGANGMAAILEWA